MIESKDIIGGDPAIVDLCNRWAAVFDLRGTDTYATELQRLVRDVDGLDSFTKTRIIAGLLSTVNSKTEQLAHITRVFGTFG